MANKHKQWPIQTLADCQDRDRLSRQFPNIKTTANNCTLSILLQTVADNFRDFGSCLFGKMSVSHPMNGGTKTMACLSGRSCFKKVCV